MGAGEAVRVEDPPPPVIEIVHESARTRVTRVHLPVRTVIRKEPLGPEAERRLRHEVAMLERLRDAEGVAQLVDAPRYLGSIVLEDVGGTSLVDVAKPLAADQLVRLGVQLARTVAEMHARGVIHRDISPANIVISADGTPCLVDFALASPLGELRPEFVHPSEIVGTLAYLAPEQTGRTGWPVDQRADLYALGATLYELATGEPPFGFGDPLRLTHDHLARVPVAPADANPAVPRTFSDLIAHLLEKEPDDRYQTTEGLVYDLERLQASERPAEADGWNIGARDVPLRLMPPSRLVGRDREIAVLEEAFDRAAAGGCSGVLIGGAAGVGKTALVDELRSVVTASQGWFVAGKFDQYRRDLESDAVIQAVRALGRLMLAQPDDEVAALRERILTAAGQNVGLVAALVPDLAKLLSVAPDPGDPMTTQSRLPHTGLAVLRAIASPDRPLVMFLDDLQWASGAALTLVDTVLGAQPTAGLLLVAAYRQQTTDAARPLTALLSRWRERPSIRHLWLENLPLPDLVTMVAEMLHVTPARAAPLVQEIAADTHGNPYDTVELLGALYRAGALTATPTRFDWDNAVVRTHLRRADMAALLATRVGTLPPASRQLVERMACLGGRVESDVLNTAVGHSEDLIDHQVGPALRTGILVVETGTLQAIRFRHDRLRETILEALDRGHRRSLHLEMARRLAHVRDCFAIAAEQYLPVADAVTDPAERRHVVDLLRRAADTAALTGDFARAESVLAAALPLIDPNQTADLVEVHISRHTALYSLGRLEEGDEEYRTIEELCRRGPSRAEATAIQVRSLTNRKRFREALRLGAESLRECGIAVPGADELAPHLDQQFAFLYQWLHDMDGGDDLARSELIDPTLLARARVLDAMLPAAFLIGDPLLHGWLSLEAIRIWIKHGPERTLVGPASLAAHAALGLRNDYATGYRVARRILEECEARGYRQGSSMARFVFAVICCWFEPIEHGVGQAQKAREELLAVGDLANAGYAHFLTLENLLDCGPNLQSIVADMEAGLETVRRTDSEQIREWFDSFRWLVDVLRGARSVANDGTFPPDKYADNPTALLTMYIARAQVAAIFTDVDALAEHTTAALPLLPAASKHYQNAQARVLRGFSLAEQARASDAAERRGLLSELDEVTQWLTARAADAPDNFLHLLRLLEAERAWAVGDFQAAALAFDAARREVARRQRPWHRALITECAARFHLAHGLALTGHELLAEARQAYLAWGATAKVHQLDWAFAKLQLPTKEDAEDAAAASDRLEHQPELTTGTIDLLGILSASRALSSETSVERLHARVSQVLSAITGATDVNLPVWDDEREQWLLPRSAGATDLADETAGEAAVPMAVLRYVQRTGGALLVADAARDERFARDPYFTDVERCSLLALPIVSRGTLRAVLLLENRLIRDAFTAERLDAVKLIAGQLAVSLDNAQMYVEFRRIADEQAALRRVATLVARGAAPAIVFEAVAIEVGTVFPAADRALVGRYTPDASIEFVGGWSRAGEVDWVGTSVRLGGHNVATTVFESNLSARVDHYPKDDATAATGFARRSGARSSAGAPISVEGRLWGVIIVASVREAGLPLGTEDKLAGFTELVATAIANTQAREELGASRARIVAAADQARRRIERDVHDGAQQRLVTLGLQLRAAQASVPPGLVELRAELDRAATEATDAMEELREIATGIHPAVLTEGGLRPALKALARRAPIPVDLQIDVSRRLHEQVEITTYYVTAEALTNAAKHARASSVTVEVESADGVVRVSVRDDGAGGAKFAGGTGLVGLKDRVEALGGSICLESPRGGGTRLSVELPDTGASGSPADLSPTSVARSQ